MTTTTNYIEGSTITVTVQYDASTQKIKILDYSGHTTASISTAEATTIDLEWYAGSGSSRTINIDFVPVSAALGITSEATPGDGLVVEQSSASYEVDFQGSEDTSCTFEVWSPAATTTYENKPKLTLLPRPSSGPTQAPGQDILAPGSRDKKPALRAKPRRAGRTPVRVA